MEPFTYQWTHASVRDFWNAHSKIFSEGYAGLFLGKYVIQFAKKWAPLIGDILDFGCGNGYLFTYLSDVNARLYVADQNEAHVEAAKKCLSKQRNFAGGEVLSETFFKNNRNRFNICFLCEVLEHVLPDDLPTVIQNVYDLMAPQGHLIIAVPNRPDCNRLDSICPNCGAVYNSAQHHTAWNKEKLDQFTGSIGFRYIQAQEKTFPGSANEPWFITLLKKCWNLYRYHHQPDLLYCCQK